MTNKIQGLPSELLGEIFSYCDLFEGQRNIPLFNKFFNNFYNSLDHTQTLVNFDYREQEYYEKKPGCSLQGIIAKMAKVNILQNLCLESCIFEEVSSLTHLRSLWITAPNNRRQINDDRFLKSFPKKNELQSLSLTMLNRITNNGMLQILPFCASLQRIELYYDTYQDNSSDDVLEGLGTYCPKLTCVDLSDLRITDQGLRALANKCTALRILRLTHLKEVTDDGLGAVIQNCNNIREITLNYNHNITGQSLVAIAEHLPDIEYIALHARHEPHDHRILIPVPVTDEQIEQLIKKCRNFRIDADSKFIERFNKVKQSVQGS